jgi:ubiquitin-protein ligase
MASVRDRRLDSDYRALRTTFEGEDLVEIRAIGTAPFEKYMIVYKVPSLRLNSTGQPMRVDATVVEITLPSDYPKMPPTARTVAGDVVFHPNFNAQKICLAQHWAPGIQLADIVREIGEMLTWQRFNIKDSLNAIAAEWSQQHLNEIPLARVNLGGNSVNVTIN